MANINNRGLVIKLHILHLQKHGWYGGESTAAECLKPSQTIEKLLSLYFFTVFVYYVLSQAFSAAIFAELYECCEFYLLYLGTYYTSFLYALVAKVKNSLFPPCIVTEPKTGKFRKKLFQDEYNFGLLINHLFGSR